MLVEPTAAGAAAPPPTTPSPAPPTPAGGSAAVNEQNTQESLASPAIDNSKTINQAYNAMVEKESNNNVRSLHV
ncbi:unnamed protein product [Caenorhabditis bovis]|uniref:Uncharacterized protein n=1 Tax=Caenorhabditis bovis TaxID=2654633 RepID=A0A8S1F646_9PELO|nr:unnamed protein product [Caenorhabditis bovis]